MPEGEFPAVPIPWRTIQSGVDIKTVNGQSILGSGDLEIEGGASVFGDLGGVPADNASLAAALAAKQATLVSNTNIKTVNGTSLLGSGNIDANQTVNNVTNNVTGGNYPVSSASADIDALITAVGASELPFILNDNKTVSAAKVFPSTARIRPGGGKFVKSGSGAIEFQGNPFGDFPLDMAIFEGFAAGDITFSGTDYPKRISAEWWDTGDDSYSARALRADFAVAGKEAQILMFPRTLTSVPAIITEHHHLLHMPGDYANTFEVSSGIISPVVLNSNTSFRSLPGARIHESSVTGDYNSGIVAAITVPGEGPVNLVENIFVEDNYFVGNPEAAWTGAVSTVMLGNIHNGGINRNVFYRTHAFNVIGGYASNGHCADGWTVNDNRFYGTRNQAIAVINGRNGQILRNVFSLTNEEDETIHAYTLIDIEANVQDETIENIIIAENLMDFRGDTLNFYTAIGVLDLTSEGSRNIAVRNNTIIGSDPIGTRGANLVTGINAQGYQLEITGNKIMGSYTAPIVVTGRHFTVKDNQIEQSADTTGENTQILLSAVADSDVCDNQIGKSDLITVGAQRAGIYERETYLGVTADGTDITAVSVNFFREYKQGLTVELNATEYELGTITDALNGSVTVSAGTLIEKTFAPSDVHTTDNTIAYTSHPFNGGALVYLTSTGTLPAHTAPGLSEPTANESLVYEVVNHAADAIKLRNPLTGVEIDFTTQGTGTHKLTPVLRTKFSNNRYSNNRASDGVRLVPNGASRILSTYEDRDVAEVADADHSIARAAGIVAYTGLSASRTVTLPDPAILKGKEYLVKDMSGGATDHDLDIVSVNGALIDNGTSLTINEAYGFARVKSTGPQWMLLERHGVTVNIPFGPDQISGLFQWLKADAITELAHNDPVSTWNDSGPGNRDATGSSTSRPLYKTNVQNGLPGLYFDGSNDILQLGDYSSLTEGETFVVVKLDADPPASNSGFWTIGGSANALIPGTAGDLNKIYDDYGRTTRVTTIVPPTPMDDCCIYSVHSAANDWSNYLNGVEMQHESSSTVNFSASASLGQSGSGNTLGHFFEFITYNRKLTTDERAGVVAYLEAKYAI